MGRPDWFARLLARILPWFDQDEFDADRMATRRAIVESRAVRNAYRASAARLSR